MPPLPPLAAPVVSTFGAPGLTEFCAAARPAAAVVLYTFADNAGGFAVIVWLPKGELADENTVVPDETVGVPFAPTAVNSTPPAPPVQLTSEPKDDVPPAPAVAPVVPE